jgi:hypothetical protein
MALGFSVTSRTFYILEKPYIHRQVRGQHPLLKQRPAWHLFRRPDQVMICSDMQIN